MFETIAQGLKRLTRSKNPHEIAETWLNGVLDAIAQGEHETVCLQPDEAGDIHAFVAGPFRPDTDIHDGTGGLRLDVETPGLFVLHADPVPPDATRLGEPLPAIHAASLFIVIHHRSGSTKARWSNSDTGLRGRSFLLDEGDLSRGIRVSAYLHEQSGSPLVKLDVRHASTEVVKWLQELILAAHQANIYAPEIRTADHPDMIRGVLTCCNDDTCAKKFPLSLDRRVLPILIKVLEQRIHHAFTPTRHQGSFEEQIDGCVFAVEVYDHRDTSGYDRMLNKKPGFTLLVKKKEQPQPAPVSDSSSGSWCEGCP